MNLKRGSIVSHGLSPQVDMDEDTEYEEEEELPEEEDGQFLPSASRRC